MKKTLAVIAGYLLLIGFLPACQVGDGETGSLRSPEGQPPAAPSAPVAKGQQETQTPAEEAPKSVDQNLGYAPNNPNPKRIVMRLGRGEDTKDFALILDSSKKSGTDYDLLVADTDLDGSLADETAVKADGEPDRRRHQRVTVTAPFGDLDAEYAFGLHTYVRGETGEFSVWPITYINLTANDGKWSYMFLGGASSDDAGVQRFDVGGPLSLETVVKLKDRETFDIAATIKSASDQTIRLINGPGGGAQTRVRPHLVVRAPSGKTIEDKDLDYG